MMLGTRSTFCGSMRENMIAEDVRAWSDPNKWAFIFYLDFDNYHMDKVLCACT